MSSPVGYPQRNAYPMFSETSKGDVPVGKDGANLIPVMAIQSPSSGVVRNSLGELVWRRGWNQLLDPSKTPTLIKTPAAYAAFALDATLRCPASSYPAVSQTIAAGDNATKEMRYDSIGAPFSLGPDDTLLIPVWIGPEGPGAASLDVRVSSEAVMSTSWRSRSISALRSGWQIVALRNGDTWAYTGAATAADTVRGIRLRIANGGGVKVAFGSPHYARHGYAKSAIVFSADDVPHSFLDLAIPLIESYGWTTTLNLVVKYAIDSTPDYISLAEARELIKRGHEIRAHSMNHADITACTDDEMRVELTGAADFWRSAGILTASKMLAWPFLANDARTRAAAKAAGYKTARGRSGPVSSWVPGLAPYNYGALSGELAISASVDAFIEQYLVTGVSFEFYLHQTIPGGGGNPNYPGASKHYLDHLRRWCDQIKAAEIAGRCVVCTSSDAWRLMGIDPFEDDLLDV